MIDIIGKRFVCFFLSLVGGFIACKYLGGVDASKYLDFIGTISGVYIAGQSASDVVGIVKGVKGVLIK